MYTYPRLHPLRNNIRDFTFMGNRFHLKYFSEVTKQMKKQTIREINSREKGRTVSKITINFT